MNLDLIIVFKVEKQALIELMLDDELFLESKLIVSGVLLVPAISAESEAESISFK